MVAGIFLVVVGGFLLSLCVLRWKRDLVQEDVSTIEGNPFHYRRGAIAEDKSGSRSRRYPYGVGLLFGPVLTFLGPIAIRTSWSWRETSESECKT